MWEDGYDELLKLIKNGVPWEVLNGRIRAYAKDWQRQISENDINQMIERAQGELGQIDKIIQGSGAISSGESPISWDAGRIIEKGRRWKLCKEQLERRFGDTGLKELSDECMAVVNCLPPPSDASDLGRRKGLVLGYVQSGKTAHMTGMMAMYADAGCKCILVLTGIHNSLNRQTESRFRKDLNLEGGALFWELITTPTGRVAAQLNIAAPLLAGRCLLGVLKKNGANLRALLAYIGQGAGEILKDKQFLIIDDECDQAGPNGNPIDGESRSVINDLIRQLLNAVPRTTYVGYTATPFVNLLNEPPDNNERAEDVNASLYPEDFIYALRQKADYFGCRQFFGDILVADQDGLDAIRTILADDEQNAMAEDLKDSIRYFICAASARLVRNHDGHMTMLVHPSGSQQDHAEYAQYVNSYLIELQAMSPKDLHQCLADTWSAERGRIKREHLVAAFLGRSITEFTATESYQRIKKYTKTVIDRILEARVRIDNCAVTNELRISYSDVKQSILIVVGGNTLSRGLTLEGLTVSWFGRTARQYDTLLQMGRWFGYRRGYEDLVRVWTTDQMKDWFAFLSGLEDDIRGQIRDLFDDGSGSGASPRDVAISILQHPDMKIARKMGIQSAEQVGQSTFYGRQPQTTWFEDKNDKWLQRNYEAACALLQSMEEETIERIRDRVIFRNVAVEKIQLFLKAYQPHVRQPDADGRKIAEFLQNIQKEDLPPKSWNVVVAAPETKNGLEMGPYRFARLTRSRMKFGYKENEAYIKGLRSPGDILSDATDDQIAKSVAGEQRGESAFAKRRRAFGGTWGEVPGLLLLYPIDRASEPLGGPDGDRAELEAVGDVVGWSIVFPNIRGERLAGKEAFSRVAVKLEDKAIDAMINDVGALT